MKTIILGDTHGRSFWKLIANTEQFDRLIFIGDYFDSFDIKGEAQASNFLDIVEYKKTGGKEVIMLIGNHDHHYFPEIGNTGTSGFNHLMAGVFGHILEENRDHLQMAYSMDDFLFTHAGVGQSWLDDMKVVAGEEFVETAEKIASLVNQVWKHKPHAFTFTGWDPYGNNVTQTPIWIRPQALMKAGLALKRKIIQVVGHTGQNCIDIDGKSTGGRYYFIDTLGTSKEYLIIEDGKLSVGKI